MKHSLYKAYKIRFCIAYKTYWVRVCKEAHRLYRATWSESLKKQCIFNLNKKKNLIKLKTRHFIFISDVWSLSKVCKYMFALSSKIFNSMHKQWICYFKSTLNHHPKKWVGTNPSSLSYNVQMKVNTWVSNDLYMILLHIS